MYKYSNLNKICTNTVIKIKYSNLNKISTNSNLNKISTHPVI